MADANYGIVKALPARDILWVPHRGIRTGFSSPAFGPDTFKSNVADMTKHYSHSEDLPKIRFREPTTAESISAVSYEFAQIAKPQILDPEWLQLGRILRTSEGVFVNPPKDREGNPVTDEVALKSYLKRTKPIKVGNGHIYIVSDIDNLRDFAYAEYETFRQNLQEGREFAEAGLARVLEHTEEKIASKLFEIASKDNYSRGVYIFKFGSVKEPALKVVGLLSGWCVGRDGLSVVGDDWADNRGYAFGVLNSAEADTLEK